MPLYEVDISVARQLTVNVDAADESVAVAEALRSLREDGAQATAVRVFASGVERAVVGRCERCDRYLLEGDGFLGGESGEICTACCDELAEDE